MRTEALGGAEAIRGGGTAENLWRINGLAFAAYSVLTLYNRGYSLI